MSVPFYFDQHVPAAIAHALRLRGVNVLTAFQDGYDRADDEALFLRATELGRTLFTQDEDFLAIAHRYQSENRPFAGLVYAHQLRVSIGRCVTDLEIIGKTSTLDEIANRVEFLPL
jgi:hypothetical protein